MSKRPTNRRRSLAGVAFAVGALAVTSVFGQGQTAASRSVSPPAGALVAPGEAPDLAILCTGDVIGYLDPCG